MHEWMMRILWLRKAITLQVDADVREQLFEEHIAKLKEKKEKDKEREKDREEKKSRRSEEDDKPRKDKKRHKKERHGEKEKGSDKKSKDKERSSKRCALGHFLCITRAPFCRDKSIWGKKA